MVLPGRAFSGEAVLSMFRAPASWTTSTECPSVSPVTGSPSRSLPSAEAVFWMGSASPELWVADTALVQLYRQVSPASRKASESLSGSTRVDLLGPDRVPVSHPGSETTMFWAGDPSAPGV